MARERLQINRGVRLEIWVVSWSRFVRLDSAQWNPVVQEHADKDNDLPAKKSKGNNVKSEDVKREDDTGPTNEKNDESHSEVDADAIKKKKDDADPKNKTSNGNYIEIDEDALKKTTDEDVFNRFSNGHKGLRTRDDGQQALQV